MRSRRALSLSEGIELGVLPIELDGSDSPRARRLAAMNDERSPSIGGLGAGDCGAAGGEGAGRAGRSGSDGAVATTGGVGAGGAVAFGKRGLDGTGCTALAEGAGAACGGGEGVDGVCDCAGAIRTANRSPILLSSLASPGESGSFGRNSQSAVR